MKKTIKGVRYDTSKCEELCSYTVYNTHSNLPVAYVYLLLAQDGNYLMFTDSTGQDCSLANEIEIVDPKGVDACGQMIIDRFDPDEKEEKRLIELGILKTPERL